MTAAAVLLWAGIVLVCSLIGQTSLNWEIWRLRMLRLIPASLAGAALSVAGVGLQSLLRNPLADPYVLGISSGSAVGAMLAMMAGAAGVITPLSMGSTTAAAAVGALATILVVYLVAQRRGRLDPYSLLMSGVIVNAFNGAVIMFLYLVATQPVFRDITVWAMGQVREQSHPGTVAVSAAVILGGWGVLLGQGKAFNVQALGEDVAGSAGVNVHRLRLTTFGASAVVTAAAVALAGPVPFVGLMVPHITRRLLGADHRLLLVAAGFAGAGFLAAADTLCRTAVIMRTGELPVGIVTALAGGPFFIVLLRRRFVGRT
jgi:iron complex transport system permease protein